MSTPLHKIFSYMVESTARTALTDDDSNSSCTYFIFNDKYQGNTLFLLNKTNHHLITTIIVDGTERKININSKFNVFSYGCNEISLVGVEVVRVNSDTIRQYNGPDEPIKLTQKTLRYQPIKQSVIDKYFSNDNVCQSPQYRYCFDLDFGPLPDGYTTTTFSGDNTVVSDDRGPIVKFLRGRFIDGKLYTNVLESKQRLDRLKTHIAVSDNQKIVYDEKIKASKKQLEQLITSTDDISSLYDAIRALNGNPYDSK